MSGCSAPGVWEGVAACVQAVVGLVRLEAAEALPPVSAVLTPHPCRSGVWEGYRRRGEPPAHARDVRLSRPCGRVHACPGGARLS